MVGYRVAWCEPAVCLPATLNQISRCHHSVSPVVAFAHQRFNSAGGAPDACGDLGDGEPRALLELALGMKRDGSSPVLAGQTLALIFEKPSLRTRTSFEMAMHRLGGRALYLSDHEVQMGEREPVRDVARVLSRMVQGIAARTFGSVESVKAVSDLISPLSGEVLEVNQKVVDEPETVNEDPYGAGWLIRIRMSDPGEVDTLMDAEAYRAHVAEQ